MATAARLSVKHMEYADAKYQNCVCQQLDPCWEPQASPSACFISVIKYMLWKQSPTFKKSNTDAE